MNLKADKATGKLEKYTKKEQLEFSKQIEKMNGFFSGLEKLSKLPDALLVVNVTDHITAVREAKRLKIPVVAILSTDTDPELVNYPIPANDNSKSSIAWILGRLQSKIEEGAKERPLAEKKAE
jgi:small subunit ribosomal protein S2